MSAAAEIVRFTPKADIDRRHRDVRSVPKADISPRRVRMIFDAAQTSGNGRGVRTSIMVALSTDAVSVEGNHP